MYKENFKNKQKFFHMAYFCRAWDDSHEFTRGMLNVIINILPSCGHICINGFRCRPSVTTSTCYN